MNRITQRPAPGGDEIEIVVAGLDAGPATVRASAALLSREERRRADRLATNRIRHRFIVGRARLRRLLGERLRVRPERVELTYGTRGKPELARAFADSGLRFNVSHCGGVAVYAIARRREVGIDVEAVRNLPEADEVAGLVFSNRELAAYLALDEKDKARGFFNGWTRKEAFIKALGIGLAYPLKSFDVSLAPAEPARILRVDGTAGDECGWTLYSFRARPGLTGAVVARTARHERIVLRTVAGGDVSSAMDQ